MAMAGGRPRSPCAGSRSSGPQRTRIDTSGRVGQSPRQLGEMRRRASSWRDQRPRRYSGKRSAVGRPNPKLRRPDRPRPRHRAVVASSIRTDSTEQPTAVRQLEIGFDDRRREPLPRRVTSMVQAVGQQACRDRIGRSRPVAGFRPARRSSAGRNELGKRTARSNRSRRSRRNDRQGPLVAVVRLGVEIDPVVEPRGRVERRCHSRFDHADDRGGRETLRGAHERSAWP